MWVEVGTVPGPAQLKQSQGLWWPVRERLSLHPGARQMWANQEASSAPLSRLGGVVNRKQLREGQAGVVGILRGGGPRPSLCVCPVPAVYPGSARSVALRAGERCTRPLSKSPTL